MTLTPCHPNSSHLFKFARLPCKWQCDGVLGMGLFLQIRIQIRFIVLIQLTDLSFNLNVPPSAFLSGTIYEDAISCIQGFQTVSCGPDNIITPASPGNLFISASPWAPL